MPPDLAANAFTSRIRDTGSLFVLAARAARTTRLRRCVFAFILPLMKYTRLGFTLSPLSASAATTSFVVMSGFAVRTSRTACDLFAFLPLGISISFWDACFRYSRRVNGLLKNEGLQQKTAPARAARLARLRL